MNRQLALWGGAVALAAAAGLAGYGWGVRHADSHGTDGGSAAGESPKARKILFYRNPMGLADTSPTPKKDSMGMDYIPVYEGEDNGAPASPNQLQFSADKVQKLGVRTQLATMQTLDKVVHAAGRIEADERRNFAIAPRFEGYVEKLHVNATGQAVAKGQPLLEVYAPDLVAAQREYAIAAQGVQALLQAGPEAQKNMQQLADASLARLRNWGLSDDQVRELAKSGTAQHTVTLRAPAGGVVTEKKAVQGMRFMPGDTLYQVSDLSVVWVVADVPEQDIAGIRVGTRARVTLDAYPDKTFSAALTYVYPTLNAETRTVPVRLELPNANGLLKPGMFVEVDLSAGSGSRVLTVPASAVLDSGTRRIVLVQMGEGRFEPREVKVGARSDSSVQVLDGVREGEPVVVSANFLIDAESNLQSVIAGLGDGAGKAQAPSSQGAGQGVNQAHGKVVDVDAKALSVTISHGAVASLKWPAMTMDFALANSALLKDLRPDARVAFEFVERKKGEWVIVKVTPE